MTLGLPWFGMRFAVLALAYNAVHLPAGGASFVAAPKVSVRAVLTADVFAPGPHQSPTVSAGWVVPVAPSAVLFKNFGASLEVVPLRLDGAG
jgi:hypothetical protein